MKKLWTAGAAVALLCVSALAVEQTALHYGAWGFDATGEDRSVKPGDDFFRFANGGWLDRTPIPADKTIFGLRALMTDLTEARLHALMEAAASQAGHEPVSLEGKVGAFYKAFQDEARVERLGAEPLKPELDAIRMADTRDALAGLMGHGGDDFYGSLFGVSVSVDRKDPSRYSVYLAQAGLGLPDRDYYSNPTLASQKAQYQVYVASLLRLAAWPEPETRAREIVELETRIAEASWTKADRRDRDKIYNPMTVAELQTFAPGFAWQAYLGSAGLGNVSQVVVAEKSAFPKLAAIYASTPVEVLKAWAAFNVADHAAPYLSRPFTAAFFRDAGKDALRHAGAAGPLEAGGACGLRRRLRCGRPLRSLRKSWVGRRPALHGKVFSAGIEGESAGTGGRPQSCVPCPDREAGLDESGDQGGGAQEARDLQR